jgi:phosphonate transport system substrate-binding protein
VKISAEDLAAISVREGVAADAQVTVVLGLHANLQQPDQFLYRWGPLINYLCTNRARADGPRLAFGLRIYTSRSNAIEGLIKGEVDLMRADPAVYILARQRATQVTPLVQEVYGNGKLDVGAAIFTRTNSGIDHISQLNGKSFAFGETISTLGDLLPKAELAANGFRIGDFLRVTNLHSDSVLAAVGGGRWDAGVTSSDHISPLSKSGGAFKILKELRSPGYPWLAIKNLDPNIAEAITKALLSLRDSNLLLRIDSTFTRFESVLPTDYDALARDIEKAKMFDQAR